MFELKKIGFVKRASALLLDAILLSVLATGFIWIISLICNYSGEEALARQYFEEWETFRKEEIPSVADYYGFNYTENGDDYTVTVKETGAAATLDDVVNKLKNSEGKDGQTKAAYDKYLALTPAEKVNAQYQYLHTMLFMMVSVGSLLAYLILEFILPLCLKNGQTIGKKVFGIGLVRPNGVKVAPVAVFARMLLGKYAVETMFPVLLVFLFLFAQGAALMSVILLAALFILNVVLFFATKNHTPIHDILAYTVAVDIKLQVVFASEDELNEKKSQAHKEFIQSEKNV